MLGLEKLDTGACSHAFHEHFACSHTLGIGRSLSLTHAHMHAHCRCVRCVYKRIAVPVTHTLNATVMLWLWQSQQSSRWRKIHRVYMWYGCCCSCVCVRLSSHQMPKWERISYSPLAEHNYEMLGVVHTHTHSSIRQQKSERIGER